MTIDTLPKRKKLAKKYLTKKECIRSANPPKISENISFLLKVCNLVHKHRIEFKLKPSKTRITVTRASPAEHLHRYILIEMYGYFESIKLALPPEIIKKINFPDFYEDGTLKKVRHTFAHPEMPYEKIITSLNNFDKKYRFFDVIAEFIKFSEKTNFMLTNYNAKLVASRLSDKDKEYFLEKFPDSYMSKIIKDMGVN
ncbi:hypothetical protein K8R33_01065 [archaeon]|nr:hypothetical protein [archaeon]